MTKLIGIFVFPGMELLDYAGPHQVFANASRLAAREGQEGFDLTVLASSLDPIEVDAALRVTPQATLDHHPPLACLIVPGGMAGIDAQIDRGDIVPWLTREAASVPILATVCTGAFLLAQTGLLNGLEATTHSAYTTTLRRRFPAIDVTEKHRWVDTGHFVTSAGLTAGIDMALHLVERLASRDLSVATARSLEV